MPASSTLIGMEREQKLQYILDATVQCVSRYGFCGATLDLIAEEAGVSKGTLSYYFKNKEDLVVNVASHLAAGFHGRVRQSLEGLTDPKERLLRIIEGFWTGYIGRPELITGYYDLWSQSFFNRALKDEVVSIYTDFRRMFLDEVVALSGQRRADGDRLLSDVILIAGVVDGVAMQFLTEPKLADWNRVLARLKEIVSIIVDTE